MIKIRLALIGVMAFLRLFTTQTRMCGMLSDDELFDKCRSNLQRLLYGLE